MLTGVPALYPTNKLKKPYAIKGVKQNRLPFPKIENSLVKQISNLVKQ